MKQVTSLVLAGALAATLAGPAAAAGSRSAAQSRSRTVQTTFRLQVSGQPAPDTTYWVAYGPLGGKFGLVQLHAAGGRLYVAERSLPLAGHTVFAYLAGRGTTHQKFGLAPGDPVVVIRRLGPMTAWQIDRQAAVQWQAPAG